MASACRELEHTADVFLEVRAPNLPTLLEHGLYALYATMVDPHGVEPRESRLLQAQGETPADLLRALLAEALFEFAVSGFLGAAADVEVSDHLARAEVWGERLDRRRHELELEVKAVTYHQLAAAQEPAGEWVGRFILDV